MLAINGRTFTEKNLHEVGWLLELLQQGTYFNNSVYTVKNSEKVGRHGNYYGMPDRYYEWVHRKAHSVNSLTGFVVLKEKDGFRVTAYVRDISAKTNILLN